MILEGRMCVGIQCDALGKGAAHRGRAVHRAEVHYAISNGHSAPTQHDALGLCTAHRAPKPKFTPLHQFLKQLQHLCSSKCTQLLLLVFGVVSEMFGELGW